jgi:pyruvate kinase
VAAYPELVGEAPLGAHIYLQDGEIDLVVEDKSAQALRCRVAVGGRLRSHVGVNLPGHTVSVPSLTPKDREDLRLGVELGVDFIALSYVRRAQDVNEARELLTSLGTEIPIIAKIEKHEAVKNLEEILDTADGLMVARGDLGVEVSLERVPLIQKQVIAAANRAGKPVITATQMLLSMVSHSRPSRAEAADAANAILDGTDAVMLSEETATGQFPVEAVKFLDRLAQIMEEDFPYTEWLRARAPERRPNISDAISYAACEMARDLEAAAILTSTAFGTTARFISRFRPRAPIIGVTPRPETWRRLCLSWGVFPLMAQDLTDTDHMIQAVKEEALKAGWLKPGQRVVITAGSPMGLKGTTNMIKADVI